MITPEQEEIAKATIHRFVNSKAWPLVSLYLEKHLAFKMFHAKPEDRDKVVAEKDVMNSFLSTLTGIANEASKGQ